MFDSCVNVSHFDHIVTASLISKNGVTINALSIQSANSNSARLFLKGNFCTYQARKFSFLPKEYKLTSFDSKLYYPGVPTEICFFHRKRIWIRKASETQIQVKRQKCAHKLSWRTSMASGNHDALSEILKFPTKRDVSSRIISWMTGMEPSLNVGISRKDIQLRRGHEIDNAPSKPNVPHADRKQDGQISEVELGEISSNFSETPTSEEAISPLLLEAKVRQRENYERIFSNLNEADQEHEQGSLASAVLLIAGTTVGAGILAIPSVTEEAGFSASAVTCVGCWLYMVTTGLLVAEVNVNTMCDLGSGGVSLVSMAERTLGKFGVGIACLTYIFIHYALLVAYVARSADILAAATGAPTYIAAAAFTGGLGSLCFFASQRVIGLVNGGLVVAILGSFGVLVILAAQGVSFPVLLHADFTAVPASVPIIALSFVYQNVVPVVTSNLEGDLRRIRWAIVLGTAIPLAMFLLWDAVILGSLPPDSAAGIDPLLRLKESSGAVGPIVEIFSFFAVATSYIGFVLGLSDFLADLLKLPGQRGRQPLPYLLTLAPPLALALLNPDIFYKALDVAGSYGVLVLFGIVPAAMAWAERYTDVCLPPAIKPIVPGGKFTLVLVIGGAAVIIGGEIAQTFSNFH